MTEAAHHDLREADPHMWLQEIWVFRSVLLLHRYGDYQLTWCCLILIRNRLYDEDKLSQIRKSNCSAGQKKINLAKMFHSDPMRLHSVYKVRTIQLTTGFLCFLTSRNKSIKKFFMVFVKVWKPVIKSCFTLFMQLLLHRHLESCRHWGVRKYSQQWVCWLHFIKVFIYLFVLCKNRKQVVYHL